MNKKCQVFTPPDYVEKLLDSVGYKHNLYGKKIIENSCGDGNILAVVVQRYIDDCISKGFSVTKIKNGLSNDIHGVEIDSEQLSKCIVRLDAIAKHNNINAVKWNISCLDYLKMLDSHKYDFVVGNPPYITYSELKEENQKYLKNNYESCKKGKFDYCYAFLEKSLESLVNTGRMAYLIPSSVYKTVFGEKIREIMLPYVDVVIDYTREKMFKEAVVKSSILVLDKSITRKNIKYIDDSIGVTKTIERNALDKKWNFMETSVGTHRFGDYFKVSHVVATLCNEAFVLKDWKINRDGDYICDGEIIEKATVRDAASPKNKRANKEEKIIFPYSYTTNHILVRNSEEEFLKKFPGAYRHLSRYRKKLEARDSDASALWFEYGRSQALNHLDYDKAMISTIISREVLVYPLDRESIPYAGMYIIPTTKQFDIKDAIQVLNHQNFLNYARNIGIPINGNSVRVTSKDIENYRF